MTETAQDTVTRGSVWQRWDLHVHTPASVVNRYPGTVDQAWDVFLADLEQLPEAFKVLGISDYLFFDGYERLVTERASGRLQNIELLLPILEFRLNRFAGTDGHLKKINAHAIFSPELDPEMIRTQFFGLIAPSYRLRPDDQATPWSGILSAEALEDLGRQIIKAAPKDRRPDYDAPFKVGFNNITVELDALREAMDSHFFKDKVLLAIGKTEWDQVKWDVGSIADKRDLINSADFLYVAAEDPAHFDRCKEKLRTAKVNDLLLDCSDAHHLSTSKDKDRVGNCFTWLKAELSFEGLRHALIDPASRVYVGHEPAQLTALERRPEAFIDRVRISRTPRGDFDEIWFDGVDLPINPGLVSVIGNRGTGKSALAEAIACACNSLVPREYFSFLTSKRFASPRDNKAQHFEAEVVFRSGPPGKARLSDDPQPEAQERIAFLPQDFLEVLCSDPSKEERFATELEEVVFSRVPTDARLGKGSLGELVRYLASESELEASRLRGVLSRTNVEFCEVLEGLSPTTERKLRTRYKELRRTLLDLKKRRPPAVARPADDPKVQAQIARLRTDLGKLEGALAAKKGSLKKARQRSAAVDTLSETLVNLKAETDRRLLARGHELELLGLTHSDLLSVEIKTEVLQSKRRELDGEIVDLEALIEGESPPGLRKQAQGLAENLEVEQNKLAAPHREYAIYRDRLNTWEGDRRALIGDPDSPDSVKYARRELADIKTELPRRRDELIQTRRDLVLKIHTQAKQLEEAYAKLYEPVRALIANHEILGKKLRIALDVRIAPEAVEERILALIHQGRRGTFQGTRDGHKILSDLAAKHDFADGQSSLEFAEAILARLHADHGTENHDAREIAGQVMEGHTVPELLDLIFGLQYLRPQYQISVGGSPLVALSPGERGLTLLVFYLLVSQDPRPLIIDQPEGNLDNESIFEYLVPCLREAKRERQIILVTHNPNLAVVCDSEQIIRAQLAKEDGYRATYSAGAIESSDTNRWLVDVLEGTFPAFNTRRRRYRPKASSGDGVE